MPVLQTRNTILLRGDLNQRPEEARAAGTITPGMLLDHATTALTQPGESPRVKAHSVAGGSAERLFALENSYVGGTLTSDGEGLTGGTIDDDYATGDTVLLFLARPGDVIYAIIAAGADAITLADRLASDGAGGFKKASGSDIRLAVPMDALDNSGSTATARLRIRIT